MTVTKTEFVVQRMEGAKVIDLASYDTLKMAKNNMASNAAYFTDRKYWIVKRVTTEETVN